MAFKATFDLVIDKAYHTTGNTVIMRDGFGQLTPFDTSQDIWEGKHSGDRGKASTLKQPNGQELTRRSDDTGH